MGLVLEKSAPANGLSTPGSFAAPVAPSLRSRRFFLDPGMRPVYPACSGELGEVPDNEDNAHLGKFRVNKSRRLPVWVRDVVMSLTIPRLAADPQVRAAAENRPALSIGARGAGVAILQQALIDLGFEMPVSTRGGRSLPDGIFGRETQGVVKRFQLQSGLQADGVAGRLTLQQLEAALIADHNLREARLRTDRLISDPIS
jgi:hypothetical protein